MSSFFVPWCHACQSKHFGPCGPTKPPGPSWNCPIPGCDGRLLGERTKCPACQDEILRARYGKPPRHHVAETVVNDKQSFPTGAVRDTIQTERQSVYGDPLKNHHGIAMQWATLLAPWWERIKNYEPIPPHVVALMMSALKLNRMRLGYKEDNYDDLAIYADRFAKAWQADKTTWGDGHGPDTTQ